jgi:hypothetical protein
VPCRVVYLNRPLADYKLDEVPSLIRDMQELKVGHEIVQSPDYSTFDVSQKLIRRNRDNLWSIVGFELPENSLKVGDFIDRAKQYGADKLTPLWKLLEINRAKKGSLGKMIPRGFEPKPNNLYSAIYVSRFWKERRGEPNALLLTKENSSSISVTCLTKSIQIPRENTVSAIYSLSYHRSFFIQASNCDFAISRMGSFSKKLQDLSGVKINYTYLTNSIEKCKAHMLVAKRLGLASQGTTHLAFFGETPLVSPNTFYSVKCSKKQALCLVTWINSVFGVLQFLQLRKETRLEWCDLLKEDLADFIVPNLPSPPTEVTEWIQKTKGKDFPPFHEQFHVASLRMGLDIAWMKWLGWPNDTLEDDLRVIYGCIDAELASIKSAMKGKKDEDTAQTTLF